MFKRIRGILPLNMRSDSKPDSNPTHGLQNRWSASLAISTTDRPVALPLLPLESALTQAVPFPILSATNNNLLRVKRSISEYKSSLRATDQRSDHLSPPNRC